MAGTMPSPDDPCFMTAWIGRDSVMKKSKKTGAAGGVKGARLSAAQAVDFERYVPTVVSRLSMKLRASAKVYFQESYGLTLLDWRIISFLAAEGPSSAYDIWTLGTLEKAAVSRALRGLVDRGFVAIRDDRTSTRRRSVVSLTKAGGRLHDLTFDQIVIRHRRLVGDLTRDQIETFIRTAQHLEKRIGLMDKEIDPPLSDYDPTKIADWFDKK
jgi:DNA-binding MarR family transcriptional regulator